jgi:hypothetical protein
LVLFYVNLRELDNFIARQFAEVISSYDKRCEYLSRHQMSREAAARRLWKGGGVVQEEASATRRHRQKRGVSKEALTIRRRRQGGGIGKEEASERRCRRR